MIPTEDIQKQLKELGFDSIIYSSDNHPGGFVGFKYQVPLGRFKGEEIEVAIYAPHFPLIPPSGPYIKPHILPISGGGGAHPFGGIHDFKQPTIEFQYWSRPFNDWGDTDRSVKTYLAFLRTLLDFE